MKITKLFFVFFFSIIVTACSGGGSSAPAPAPVTPGGGGGISGTAAQYFTKLAVGNTWTWAESGGSKSSAKITNLSGGKITTISQPGSLKTTALLDATGALVTTSYLEIIPGKPTTTAEVSLPATFSVGTTWTIKPATAPISAVTGTIVAFNVTRTVPAGTFTDCLQVVQSYTAANGTANPTIVSVTSYLSPTAGTDVYMEFMVGSNTVSHQLITGYTANSVLSVTSVSPGSGAVGSVVAINGVDFSATLASNIVRFNGILATISSATTTQLMVTVPATAASGKVTVTVGGITATSAVDYTVTTPGGISGTASQYFTKTAIGNTWTHSGEYSFTTGMSPGVPTKTNSTSKITNFLNGVVTFSGTSTDGTVPPKTSSYTSTLQIDSNGALVSKDATNSITTVMLPANFSVGTTWVERPATSSFGASNGKIIAFNVTRAVPGGTFPDCLQIESTQIDPNGFSSVNTFYISPSVGMTEVESIGTTISGIGTRSNASQLQAGFIAK